MHKLIISKVYMDRVALVLVEIYFCVALCSIGCTSLMMRKIKYTEVECLLANLHTHVDSTNNI